MTKTGLSIRRQRAVLPLYLRSCGAVFMALAWLAAAAQGQTLGTTSLLVGPAAGTNSVVLSVPSPTASWVNTANADWLSLSLANQSGEGSTNVIFTFTANLNSTRTGTLTIDGQTLTVTQAGSNYVEAQPLTGLVSSGLNDPYGVAVDRAGNVYIADSDHSAIKEWSLAGNIVTPLVSANLSYPGGVAVDGAGNVYIADTGHNAIKEWTVANASVTSLVSSGLAYPYGVAVDGAGNVYIADTFNSAIKMWSVTNHNVTTLVSSGLNEPHAVAVDAAGNVYIADTENSAIKMWSAANSNVTTLVSSGLAYPGGVAVDGGGNVYIADTYNSAIKEWLASGNVVTNLISSGLFYPEGLAINGANNLYVADTLDSAIKEAPYAFVVPTPKLESQTNGTDELAPVLPATENLLAPFTPTSSATSWLTISDVTNGVVSFSFTANNTGSTRTANITLLGQNIPVTQNAQPPSITTLPATAVTSSNATLNASVNPQGATTVYFAYGTTSNYGSTNVLTNAISGISSISVSANVAGLLPGTVYYFDAFASNGAGTASGTNSTFMTQAGAPLATTQPATGTSYGNATLNGLVNPDGSATTVYFVYGPTTSYGSSTPPMNIGSGTNEVSVSSTVTGLLTNTFYHFEVMASNIAGTASGGDQTFSNSSTATYNLGALSLLEGPAAGTNSVALAVRPQAGTWTAEANAAWLHLTPANQSGTGSANVIFSFDANTTNGTRTNTLTIAGQMLTVIQASSNYVAAQPVTTLASAGLNRPRGLAVDSNGNVYFSDTGSNTVMVWTEASDTLTTLVSAGLNLPWGLAVDGAGNVYIADSGNNAIKKWTAATGTVTNLVSSGLLDPRGVAVDNAGNLYIADTGGNAILEWTPGSTNLITLTSNGLAFPSGVAVDVAGNVYIADTGNNEIQEWSAATSNLTTLVSANLNDPLDVAVDGSGNVYIADTGTNEIQEWSAADGKLTTLLSNELASPYGVAVDGMDNVYFANTGSNAIEELPYAFVDPAPQFESDLATNVALPPVLPVTANLSGPFSPASSTNWLTITGISNGVVGFSLSTDTGVGRTASITLLGQTILVNQGGSTFSLGTTSLLEGPAAGSDSVVLAVSPNFGAWTATANAGWLHLSQADQSGTGGMNVVFSYDANSGASRQGTLTVGGQTLTVTQAGSTYVPAQPQTTLVSSGLANPHGVAVDASGNVYIADSGQSEVKVWTVANDALLPLVSAGLSSPRGVAVDGSGNVYISDYANNAIYEWKPASETNVTLVSSGLFNPLGLAVDGAGNVYIADYNDFVIKEYSVANSNLSTLVSSGLFSPTGVAVDAAGNLYIVDSGNNAIEKWTAANSNVTTLVAGLDSPAAVAVDGSGNVYIADTGNGAIKKWTAAGSNVTTLVSGLAAPSGVAVDDLGNVYFDTSGSLVEELPRAFVDTAPILENAPAGADALSVVLPTAENLLAPFTPTSSDTSWLTITGAANGVVSFSFTGSTALRTASITVLGQSIPVTQGSIGTPPTLMGVQILPNGVLQFTFTNAPNASFTVLSSTNLALPLSDWTVAGTATNIGSDQFQFTAPPTTNETQVFYVVRSP